MDTARLPVTAPSTWTDIQGLSSLAGAARQDSKAALPAAARQFEAVFAQMLIKSMRSASLGSGILDSPQSKEWMGMFDNQIALSMANDGKGLGIAAMLVRQLGGHTTGATPAAGAPATPATPADATSLTAQLRAARTIAGSVATLLEPAYPSSRPAQGQSASSDFLGRAMDFAKSAGRTALQVAQKVVFTSPEDFVQKLAPYAETAARKLGVDVRAVLAQAALETGWGKHMPHAANGSTSCNLFGIKAGAGWDGKRADAATLEYQNGTAVQSEAAFRTYNGPARSFADYTQLLTDNPRYAGVLGHGEDIAGFARALHRAGYATDPSYARKLTAIANSSTMRDALASLKNPSALPTPGA